jgi:hypothetical protein
LFFVDCAIIIYTSLSVKSKSHLNAGLVTLKHSAWWLQAEELRRA